MQGEKTPYIDGYVGILQGGIFRLTVDVQIRSLPKEELTDKEFSFLCETKILNYVCFSVSANPTALFVADKKTKRVFFKILTKEYVESLNIGKGF